MSYLDPMPIIPQTPDQAIQRDQAAGLDTSLDTPSPQLQIQQLRNAILEHRNTVSDPTDADLKLWDHIAPPSP